MNPLILTFDVGTQSSRALLIDKKGNILAKSQLQYKEPYYSKENGYAEQKPDFYFNNMKINALELKEKYPDLMKDVIGVTIACIRDTVLCLDKDLHPLRDIIIWLDKREAKLTDLPKLPGYKKALFSLVGVTDMCTMQQKQSICNWIMTKEPEIWEKTYKYVLLPTYINYLLTGKLTDSIANQIGHLPMDYKNNCWMEKGLTKFLFDIPTSKLVPLVKPGEIIGTIKDEIANEFGLPVNTPLIASGSDKGCETLGLSVMSRDKAAISFGTTATIQFTTNKYFEPQPFAPSYPAVVDKYFNAEIQIYRGYWMLSWFKNEFCAEERAIAEKEGVSTEEVLNRSLKDVPVGNNGLILQPFWGAGVSNPAAKGAIIGFSDIHGKKEIYRSIIEGINYALYEGMKTMEKRSKQTIKEVYIGGGGSQSDEICQMTADMFGLPAKRIQTHEACGLGGAIVCFTALGEYKSIDEAVKGMVHDKDVFTPNAKNHDIYLSYYKTYTKMYKRLEPLYNELKREE